MARDRLLGELAALVAADTRNPPRAAAGIAALFARVKRALAPAGFDVDAADTDVDLGDGCRWLYLRRGEANRAPLVNVHIDTVPLADDATSLWRSDPFVLTPSDLDGEAIVTGLGACDIKGAVAAFVDAALDTDGPAALLLTSDEEAGSSLCVRTFCERHPDDVDGRGVLVAEPTRGRAVLGHRGIGTALFSFSGVAGHASQQRAIADNAIARCARFMAHALDVAAADDNAIRLNLGRIEGGTKANMIAASCSLRLGVRPLAGDEPADVLARLFALADPASTSMTPGFLASPLPARRAGRSVDDARAAAAAVAAACNLEVGGDVDFFTEAAFFSAAGANALVFGPGDIAQAHAANEWVRVSELVAVADAYRRLLARR